MAGPGFWKGGFFYRLPKAAAQRRVAPISPREVRKIFFAFIFQLSGWALVAPLCFAQQVRCERIAGPGAAMCFRFLLKFRSCNVIATRTRSYVHVNILDRGLVPKPFGFSQLHPAVNFVPGTTVHRTVTATYVFRSVLDSCSSPLQASA